MCFGTKNIKDIAKFNKEKLEPQILKENGQERLMLMAILKEQELPTHISPIEASIFVISGKIEVIADNKKYEIEKGNIFSMPANTPHSVKGLEDSYFFVLRMKNFK